MKNKTGKVIVSAILLLLFWLALSPIANAQTPTPPTREALIQAIQARAQKDVELGTAPLSPSDLAVLFSDQASAVGISMNEVKDIYDEAYKAATPAKSPWDDLLKPQGGWIFLIVGALLVILANIAKDYLTACGKKLAEAVYQRLARFRPFWAIALWRYRRSLENTYRVLKIPFRQGKPLQMQDVYVPVRVEGGDKKQVDAYQTIQNHKRLVVLGDPGSGKTMLLRNVAFTYARQGLYDFPGHPIPVYLELNRVKSAGNSLLEALTKTLENHNFPGAEGFVKATLESQLLLILLDGLDEVNAPSRPALVQQIEDLWQKYPDNRIIVTCRKAVYQGELDAWVDQKLEIIEFSDQQIQRFMTSWQKDMPAEKSIEHFFRTLQERPQIMALARNPLLLTMVAYLYTDTEFALPHSRSKFYSRSTDLLLNQWKLERNRYKATHKRIVLQRLALFNQSQAGKTGERRTMELADVLKEIRDVLPDLTLKTEDAQPLLDEIVQRTGLMLAIDGGVRYQFTHLTLQEYFAARALEAEQSKLLDFYRADPVAWREVVRLWCALEHDSTAMLKELEALDPVMAFECLSDAQQVDNTYADELIQSFQPRLHEALTNDSLANAFAFLAANQNSPRGRKWFDLLKETLNNKTKRKYMAAYAVLARTNIPQAAKSLAFFAAIDSRVIPYLVQLGNLAVPTLKEPAQKGVVWAMDALVDIGTPQAALVLQPLLWPKVVSIEKATFRDPTTYRYEETTSQMYRAAWYLAAMLSLPGVEDILKAATLPSNYRKAEKIEWVWEPFSDNATLRSIVGRIAFLLTSTPETELPSKKLPCDPRLSLAICAVAVNVYWNIANDDREQTKEQLDAVSRLGEKAGYQILQEQKSIVNVFSNHLDRHKVLQHLYSALNMSTQFDLLPRLAREYDSQSKKDLPSSPSTDDWRNLFKPVSYNFSKSWHVKALKSLLVILIILGGFGIWRQIGPYTDTTLFGSALLCVGFAAIILILNAVWTSSNIIVALICVGLSPVMVPVTALTELIHNGDAVFVTTFVILYIALVLSTFLLFLIYKNTLAQEILRPLGNNFKKAIAIIVLTLVIPLFIFIPSFMFSSLFYYAGLWLYNTAGGTVTTILFVIWTGTVYILYITGKRLERRAQNPLHGLLEPSGAVVSSWRPSSWLGRWFWWR